MLSSLGRNGFVEGLSATRHNRGAVHLHRRLRYGLPVAAFTTGHSLRHTAAPAHPLTARFLSTSGRPTPPKSAANATVQPVPPPAPRKNKVELRPGPVKPPKPSPAATATASKPAAPTASPSTSTPEPPAAPHETVVEAAKHDFEDASQHGILVPPPEGASWPRRLFHQAKELFKFYWRGIKLVELNRRRAHAIRERVRAGGAPLSRWETRFISTNRTDMLKLVPFALIILVIEEIIPLIVMYAPFVLPSTCILPSQKERIDTKRREKQKTYAEDFKRVYAQLHKRGLEDSSASLSALLDKSSLSPLSGLLCLPTFGPSVLRLSRIQRHLAAIAQDDALLKREQLGQRLSFADARDALEERGIITEGLPQKQWHGRLQWWLAHADAEGTDPIRQRILLVASSGAGRF